MKNMYRSASWNRVPDDYSVHSSSAKPSSGLRLSSSSSTNDGDEQPPYDPVMEIAKKDKARNKFAENAVHVIPFVLLACAFVLWFFSNPDVDVEIRGDSVAARIEGLTIEGDIDNDSDGTQTGFLAAAAEQLNDETENSIRAWRKLGKGFK